MLERRRNPDPGHPSQTAYTSVETRASGRPPTFDWFVIGSLVFLVLFASTASKRGSNAVATMEGLDCMYTEGMVDPGGYAYYMNEEKTEFKTTTGLTNGNTSRYKQIWTKKDGSD